MSDKLNINDLIFRLFDGETSPEENAAILEWKQADNANRRKFESMRAIWLLSTVKTNDTPDAATELARLKESINQNSTPSVDARKPSLQTGADSEAQKTNFPTEVDSYDSSTEKSVLRYKRKYRHMQSFAAAVLFAAILGIGAFLYLYRNVQHPVTGAVSAGYAPDTILFTANLGSRASATLSDGTVIRLNAGSSIVYTTDYGIKERNVSLSGEAFFQVSSNPDKPFTVSTGELSIIATGTAFNVKVYPEEHFITTTLESGSVNVVGVTRSNDRFNVKLQPRQTFIFYKANHIPDRHEALNPEESEVVNMIKNNDIPAVRLSNVRTQLYTSWKDKRWIVENETLASLTEKIGRRYNVTFQFTQPEAKKYRFTGSFENETIEEVMQLLGHATPIRYTIDKGNITISVDSTHRTTFERVVK